MLTTTDDPATLTCDAAGNNLRATQQPTANETPSANRRKLRALHVINGEHYAGAERVQDLLALRLPDYGVEVGFACVKPAKFPALRRSQQAPLHEFPMRSRVDPRPAWRLARLIKTDGYDVLHTHSARAAIVARLAAKLTGVPVVHHVHGNTSTEVRARRFTGINAWVERRLLPGSSAVIAVSTSVAEYLRGCGVQSDRLFVVPNGVPCRTELADRRFPRDGWTLGFIALLRPRKGLEVLLDAAAILRTNKVRFTLRIVGPFETSEYEQQIHRQVNQLHLADAVEWRGFQPDIDREMDAMDMLLFPSVLPEGMPMVLLEAMAAGVPIVASRVAGVSDLLRSGQDSLLITPHDPQALATTVMSLIENESEWQRLRRAAYDRQVHQFSDRSMAAAVADLYRQVLVQK